MLENLKYDVITILSKVQIKEESDVEAVEEQHRKAESAPKQFTKAESDKPLTGTQVNVGEAGGPRVGRNDPCPCGSGQKYKKCHGKLTGEVPSQVVNQGQRVGRNDPCPCGSGEKYKNCHGKLK